MISLTLTVKLFWEENYRTSLMRSQDWLRWRLDASWQQISSCADVAPNLCRHIVSLYHNMLNKTIFYVCWKWFRFNTLRGMSSHILEIFFRTASCGLCFPIASEVTLYRIWWIFMVKYGICYMLNKMIRLLQNENLTCQLNTWPQL